MTDEELHLYYFGKMLALLYQYRDDVRHGIRDEGSRERRLEAIEALLSQILALPPRQPVDDDESV